MLLAKRSLNRITRPLLVILLGVWLNVGNCDDSISLGVLPVFSRNLYESRLAHTIKFMESQRVETHQFNDICGYMASVAAKQFDLYLINLTILSLLDPSDYRLILRSSKNQTIYLLHKRVKGSEKAFTFTDLADEMVYLPSPLTDTSQTFYHYLKTRYPELLGKVKLIHTRLSQDRNVLKWLQSDAQAAVVGDSAFRQISETMVDKLDMVSIETDVPLTMVVAAKKMGEKKIDSLAQSLLQANTLPAVKQEFQLMNLGKLVPVDMSIEKFLATMTMPAPSGVTSSGC